MRFQGTPNQQRDEATMEWVSFARDAVGTAAEAVADLDSLAGKTGKAAGYVAQGLAAVFVVRYANRFRLNRRQLIGLQAPQLRTRT